MNYSSSIMANNYYQIRYESHTDSDAVCAVMIPLVQPFLCGNTKSNPIRPFLEHETDCYAFLSMATSKFQAAAEYFYYFNLCIILKFFGICTIVIPILE